MQKVLQEPGSNESRTLGVLQHHGLLEFVEGTRDLLSSVQIISYRRNGPRILPQGL